MTEYQLSRIICAAKGGVLNNLANEITAIGVDATVLILVDEPVVIHSTGWVGIHVHAAALLCHGIYRRRKSTNHPHSFIYLFIFGTRLLPRYYSPWPQFTVPPLLLLPRDARGIIVPTIL